LKRDALVDDLVVAIGDSRCVANSRQTVAVFAAGDEEPLAGTQPVAARMAEAGVSELFMLVRAPILARMGELRMRAKSFPYSWSSCEFVLTDEYLERFDPKEKGRAQRAKGAIMLADGPLAGPLGKPEFAFTVGDTTLQAASEAERAEWVSDINRRIMAAVGTALVTLTHQFDFDTNGVLYRIGTENGTRTYENPQTSGAVTVHSSSDTSRHYWYAPHRLVQHQHDGNSNFITLALSRPCLWMMLVLGGGARVALNHYCLRHGDSSGWCEMRNWKLQGSNDGETWTTLSVHSNDQALKGGWATAGWAVEGGKGAFSHFRVYQISLPDANGQPHGIMYCAGIELYGALLPPRQ
jgi:hypothetical protein